MNRMSYTGHLQSTSWLATKSGVTDASPVLVAEGSKKNSSATTDPRARRDVKDDDSSQSR